MTTLLLAAFLAQGGEPCYRLARLVEHKPVGAEDAAFKVQSDDQVSYLTPTNVEGAMINTIWVHPSRIENLWFTEAAFLGDDLIGRLQLQTNRRPFGPESEKTLWTMEDKPFRAGLPWVFRSRIEAAGDAREYRITVSLARLGPRPRCGP